MKLETSKRARLTSWLFKPDRTWPQIPAGQRVYAVGDVHGRLDLLTQILERIVEDAEGAATANSLIFLGDYIDRGLESCGVIECLSTLAIPGWDIVCLRGNHDEILLEFVRDPTVYRVWRDFGGVETLLSYGVSPPRFDDERAFATAQAEFLKQCPPSHLEFLRRLSHYHVVGDYMFVHAGVRPGLPLDQQSPHDLMWIRDEFLSSDKKLGKMIVHGHTPTERPVERRNRIGIDTGAYVTGCLTAVLLEGRDRAFLSTADRSGRA